MPKGDNKRKAISCFCGQCKTCLQRVYMREWRKKKVTARKAADTFLKYDTIGDWNTRSYTGCALGGAR